MPTTTKNRYSTKKALTEYVYAPLGAGDLLVEKSRQLTSKAWTAAREQRKQFMKSYRDLAKRGERMVTSVRRSVHTRRAVDQAKTARIQVKSAVTSVRKSANATTKATKAAAKKVG